MNLITPDFGIIFWQTVTFVFVLIVLKKFAWNSIIKSIQARENRIQGAILSAKEAKKQLDLLQYKSKEIIDKASLEGEQIIKEAISEKQKIVNLANLESKKIAEEEIKKLRKLLEKEKRVAIMEMKGNVADLVINVAEKLLMQKMQDPKQQKEHLIKMIERVNEAI